MDCGLTCVTELGGTPLAILSGGKDAGLVRHPGHRFGNLALTVAVACALLAFQIVQAPSAAGQSVLLDSTGMWTLHDLGYSDIVLPAGGGTSVDAPSGLPTRLTAPVTYLLPESAAQGPDLWYIVHFHFEIEFQEDTQGGTAEIFTMINFDDSPPFGAGASVQFNPIVRDGSLAVDWNTLGLTDGRQTGTAGSRQIEMRASNYISNGGVVPGENSLVFAVREYEGAKIATLHVFDDTSIEVTPLSPPQLSVEVTPRWEPPAKGGDTFEVPYTVTNVGGWPAKDVVTGVSYPEDLLRLVEENAVTTPLLDGGEQASGAFKFEALSSGQFDITVRVQGQTGNMDETTVTATITSSKDVSKVTFWGLVALVLAASALPLIPFGRLLDSFVGRGAKRPD